MLRTFSEEEKKEIISKVVKLKGDHLVEVVRLVRVNSPEGHVLESSQQEVILDFDKISQQTIARISIYLQNMQKENDS